MGGGAELPPQDSQEHEPWSAHAKSESQRERNGASLKSKASSTIVRLDNAVVVIDGMTRFMGLGDERL
jgi:hypothetical protein